MDEKYVALDVKRTDGGVDRFHRDPRKDDVSHAIIEGDQLRVRSNGNETIAAYAAHGWMSYEWVRADD